jgi:beta-galactosidase
MTMKFSITSLLFLLLTSCLLAQTTMKRTLLFDEDWRFYRGGAQGAEQVSFDDSGWRKVSLPHDWSIEDIPGTASPFSTSAISQVSGGFTVGGTGWYRKTFSVAAGEKGKRILIQFDGVYMNADVWLNGKSLGKHPYGYTSFWFDITDRIKFGENNILAVRLRNEGENSRWYSGSGIYRHVWLKAVEPVHVAQWGTFITTPEVNTASAKVKVKTNVTNETGKAAQVTLVTRIINNKGTEAAKTESKQTIEPGASFEFNQELSLKSPELWSVESPALQKAVSEVYVDQQLTDKEETTFGIRSISFDAVNGFRLNGKTLKLKGGCMHQDNGPLGAKAYDRADERRIELLKASGYNAIRCAHNPPSPAFLEACDRLGMLVIDEAFDAWKNGKNQSDYHLYFNEWWQKDIESMVYRDRNHPSIIMWSSGNEIPNRDKPEVVAVAKMLSDHIHKLDATRPVTCGVNGVEENKDPFFATLDVAGYNYALDKYESDHQRLPQRVIFATESFPLESFEYWMGVTDHPWVIGDFVWTSFDYIGEASIGWLGYPQTQNFFPWNLAYCGDIDICGWKRPQSYYRNALWMPDQLSVFVKPPQPSFETNPNKVEWSRWEWHDVVADWNWKGAENKPLEVEIYSSCEQAELFLNGKSLGKKPTNRSTKFMAVWQVPYQAGVLKAVGYNGKKQVALSELHTSEEPSQIKLSPDRNTLKADGQDLSYVTVELADDKGVRNPKAENLIKFEIEGPGSIVGVGNANPRSIESNQLPQRKAWQGKCLVIIKSKKEAGSITLKAQAEGLKPSQVVIAAK